jgi:cytoskeletal protein RodZ
MAWWIWILLGWVFLAVLGALVVGAAAQVIKRREQEEQRPSVDLAEQRLRAQTARSSAVRAREASEDGTTSAAS